MQKGLKHTSGYYNQDIGEPVQLSLYSVMRRDQLMNWNFLKLQQKEIIALYERIESIK